MGPRTASVLLLALLLPVVLPPVSAVTPDESPVPPSTATPAPEEEGTAQQPADLFTLPDPPDPKEIERLRGEVASLRSRVEGRKGEVTDASAEARRLDLLVQLLSRERALAEAELRRAAAEGRTVAGQIARGEAAKREALDRLGRRLAALYRLGSGGILRLLVSPGSADRLSVARTLALLARRDRRLLRELDERGATLARQNESLVKLRELVAELAKRATAREAELRDVRNRQKLVADELRQVQARDAKRLAEIEERAGRLEKLLELIAKTKRSPTLAGEDLRRYRGALSWPVAGGVAIRFGRQKHPRFDAWVMNNGIEIDAAAGRGVEAVLPGRVVYARWLKGYGNMVIVDHGARLLTLYGHLGAVSVVEGANVRMGQSVGAAAAPGGDDPSTVYFEVRDGGKAVDPLGWLRPAAATGN